MKVRELFKVMGCFNRIEIYECKKDFSEQLIDERNRLLRERSETKKGWWK